MMAPSLPRASCRQRSSVRRTTTPGVSRRGRSSVGHRTPSVDASRYYSCDRAVTCHARERQPVTCGGWGGGSLGRLLSGRTVGRAFRGRNRLVIGPTCSQKAPHHASPQQAHNAVARCCCDRPALGDYSSGGADLAAVNTDRSRHCCFCRYVRCRRCSDADSDQLAWPASATGLAHEGLSRLLLGLTAGIAMAPSAAGVLVGVSADYSALQMMADSACVPRYL